MLVGEYPKQRVTWTCTCLFTSGILVTLCRLVKALPLPGPSPPDGYTSLSIISIKLSSRRQLHSLTGSELTNMLMLAGASPGNAPVASYFNSQPVSLKVRGRVKHPHLQRTLLGLHFSQQTSKQHTDVFRSPSCCTVVDTVCARHGTTWVLERPMGWGGKFPGEPPCPVSCEGA